MHQLLPDVSFWPPFVSFFLTRILNSAPFGTPGYQGFGIHTNFTWRPTPTEAFTSAHMWWSSQHIWPPWHLSRDTQVGFRSHLYSIFSFMLASGTFTCVQGFSSTALKPDDVILAICAESDHTRIISENRRHWRLRRRNSSAPTDSSGVGWKHWRQTTNPAGSLRDSARHALGATTSCSLQMLGFFWLALQGSEDEKPIFMWKCEMMEVQVLWHYYSA